MINSTKNRINLIPIYIHLIYFENCDYFEMYNHEVSLIFITLLH